MGTTTKINKRGITKKKTSSNGVKLKQKTFPSGKQKIKGTVKTKNKKYVIRNKGKVRSSK